MEGKLHLIRTVLGMRMYALIAVIGAAGLGALYYYITMSILPVHFGIMTELSPYQLAASIGLTGAISVLAGINFALLAYRIRRNRLVSSSPTILGSAFAAFTPGCPACTAPLAVILGTVGGLSIFPMQGVELKLLSVGALIFSIYWLTREMQKKSCCRITG